MKVEFNEIRSVYINEDTSSKDLQFEWKLNLNTREFHKSKKRMSQNRAAEAGGRDQSGPRLEQAEQTAG
jgi:hypothetical protein